MPWLWTNHNYTASIVYSFAYIHLSQLDSFVINERLDFVVSDDAVSRCLIFTSVLRQQYLLCCNEEWFSLKKRMIQPLYDDVDLFPILTTSNL